MGGPPNTERDSFCEEDYNPCPLLQGGMIQGGIPNMRFYLGGDIVIPANP